VRPADYEHRYGFRESPFTLTANPRFTFDSRTYAAAIDAIGRALDRHEPLLVITGPSGSGKTLVCRTVSGWRDGRTFIAWLPTPPPSASDLLRLLLDEFKVLPRDSQRSADASHFELARALEHFLMSLGERGARAMVLVDDAQRLTKEGFEALRSLMTFETESRKLLQIVLLGEPTLEAMLSDPELTQLSPRVTRRRAIDPILPEEVDGYIEHRLSVAQGEPVAVPTVFSKEALDAISTLSERVPRAINLLCDRSLEVAHALERSPVSLTIVIEAARSLGFPIPASLRVRRQKGKLAAVGALLLAAVAAGWWMYTPGRRPAAPAASQGVAGVEGTPQTAAAQPPAATAPATTDAAAPPSSVASSASGGAAPTSTAGADPAAGVAAATSSTAASSSAGPPTGSPAAAPTASTTASPGAVPGGSSGFHVIASSFLGEARAAALSERVSSELGLPVRVRLASGFHQVVVGPYATREEADAARDSLRAVDVTDALVAAIVPRTPAASPSPALEAPTPPVPTLPPSELAAAAGTATSTEATEPPGASQQPLPDGVRFLDWARNLAEAGDVRGILRLRDAAESQLVREGKTAEEVGKAMTELEALIQTARRRRLELDAKALEPPR
jgi:general secretion pathway protein A